MTNLNNSRNRVFFWFFVFYSLFGVSKVWAEGDLAESIQAPCAVLESFRGDVQILDESRTHLVDASPRAPLPCGSWVSVNQGWAQVRHQKGPHVHLASQTFVQFPGFQSQKNSPSSSGSDHLLLYRGQIYVHAGGGEDEFRIVSATGRARVKNGKMILLFNSAENGTQLIALRHSASLENRFEPSRQVRVQEGESTDLNFKLMRVVPTPPSAISVASLRPKLSQLHILEIDQLEAVRAVILRQGRHFATALQSTPLVEPERRPAGQSLSSHAESYARHAPDPADSMLHQHLLKKMAGGEQLGEKILYPDRFYGGTQKVGVAVEDPSEKLKLKQRAQDDEEKKRLMEELSQIHGE